MNEKQCTCNLRYGEGTNNPTRFLDPLCPRHTEHEVSERKRDEVSEAASEIRQSDHFASVVAGVQSDTDPVIEAAMEVVKLFASMRGAWFVSGSRLTFLADALTNCRRAKELEKGE